MNLGKKTKIVCTIGPATESKEKLTDLVAAGMNVMRLNFSHGDHAEHQMRVDNLRDVMKKTGKSIAILQDLGGPKIRIGEFKDGSITLKVGQKFTITTKVVGGTIKGRRGVNLPGAYLSIRSITAKDREDVKFGIKNKVDFVALSFVRRAADVKELRSILNDAGCNAQIVSKIETPEALENIDEIIELSDAIMVARGDLAIEIPAEDVPITQKLLIRKCNEVGKPVITATQMLESMIKSPVPTRAEVSDIANAIIDGTDAIMLSEETTLGEFPVEAVKMMTRVAMRIEGEVYTHDTIAEYSESHGVSDVVSQSAVRAAHNVGAKVIVALTRSGKTARMMARYRPAEAILALTDNATNANKLALSYGCYPMIVPTFKTVDEIMKIVRDTTLDNKLVNKGDHVVIVAGMPFGSASHTNFILVETL